MRAVHTSMSGVGEMHRACSVRNRYGSIGRFTRYDFDACNKLTTGLRHKLFRVNQTYNLLTTVVYVTKKVVGF